MQKDSVMKTFVYSISLSLCFFSAYMLGISCAKQEAQEPSQTIVPAEEAEQDADAFCTIQAGLADAMKTTIEVEGTVAKVTWSENDHIGVFAGGGTIYDFQLKKGAGSRYGTFICMDPAIAGKSLDGIAVYPYQADLSYNTGTGSVQVYVPTAQGYALSSAPMIATDAGDYYNFRNLGGVFQFSYNNVPPEAKSFKFTAASSDVSGIFTLSAPSDNLTTDKAATPLASENTKEIVVAIPVARPDGSVTVQVPVPAGTYSGVSFALCDADGNELAVSRKTPSRSISIGVNHFSPIAAYDLPEGLKVQWAWDDGGSLAPFAGNVPAIDADGNVYVMADSPYLYKVDRNGDKVWSFSMSGMSGTNAGSPSLELDGSTVYAAGGGTTGALYAVTASGGQKWEFTGWGPLTSPCFAQAMIAVGDGDNIYVPCNQSGVVTDGGTVFSISKNSGDRVGLLLYNDVNLLGTGSGSIALSAEGTAGYQSMRGVYTLTCSDMDNPPYTHATYGKCFRFGYRDTFGDSWSDIMNLGDEGRHGSISQGVICAKKGPTSQKNVMISCYQRGASMLVTCNDALAIKGKNQYMDTQMLRDPGDAGRLYYWRFPFGSNPTGYPDYTDFDPAIQDMGGIVMGHEDKVVLLPLKQGNGASTRMWKPAGIMALSVLDNAEQVVHQNFNGWTSVINNTTMAAMRNWRFVIRPTASASVTPVHSVEPNPCVSGAPAVDNNGWVHLATRDCYHIINAPAKDTGGDAQIYNNITSVAKVKWIDLLNASGALGYEVTSADALTSVKIGDDGRMYVNLNVNGDKGVVVCLTYPGVGGPDITSSWPQKGADPRNSCVQVHDPSTWKIDTHPISWN